MHGEKVKLEKSRYASSSKELLFQKNHKWSLLSTSINLVWMNHMMDVREADNEDLHVYKLIKLEC